MYYLPRGDHYELNRRQTHLWWLVENKRRQNQSNSKLIRRYEVATAWSYPQRTSPTRKYQNLDIKLQKLDKNLKTDEDVVNHESDLQRWPTEKYSTFRDCYEMI